MEITQEEYDYLTKRDRRLTRLENAGVDNWDGYEDCLDEDEIENNE